MDFILTSYQPDYAVLHAGQLVGVVSRDDVLRALATDPRDQFVTAVMHRNVVRVDAGLTLDQVRDMMGERGVRVVAVYQADSYLGLVSIEDIAEAFAVLAFLNQQRGQAGVPPPPPVARAETPTQSIQVPPTYQGPLITPPPVDVPTLVQPEAVHDALHEVRAALAAKQRRLNALEIQQRFFGENTPAHISTEIAELRLQIAELEGQLELEIRR